MKRTLSRTAALALGALAATGLVACSPGGAADTGGETFTILQYESETTAQGQGWALALEIFKERHPDVEVDFQTTSFDAFRQNSKIVLSGSDVPDVVEFNKGNADGGQLAAQGLLSPLTDQVAEYGWDEKVTGSMQAFARYDENGLAGSGDWYGVPNIGEYVMFYYNKELFAQAGITEIPSTLEGFEDAMDQLLALGVTPISSSASTSQGFNQMWIWYSLVSAYADREAIDDFMFLRDEVDFESGAWLEGTQKFQEWIEAGYTGDELAGLNFDQATLNFLAGDTGMLIWNQGEFNRIRETSEFDWGFFTLPGANMSGGSSGHLWGVPAEADNKDLAYEWIDITLSPEVQNLIGEHGGLPLAGDTAQISDPLTREFTERFDALVEADTLTFYADYPVPGLLDFLMNHMQAMSNGNETADEYLAALQEFYDSGRSDVLEG